MITYQYAPVADGGVARQTQLLAERLVARGRRVGVVTARFPGTSTFERLAGVEIHRVWAIPKPGTFSATFLPSLARFLLFHGRGYDIWHAHQAFYNAAVALSIARLYGTACVVKDASSGLYGDMARLRRIRLGGWVQKELLRADAIVSLNKEMTQELLDAGIEECRIRAIPNGVDCENFSVPSLDDRRDARKRLGIPRDGLLALFAGRLAEDKGTGFLIDAWRLVESRAAGKRWTLIIAGDEPRPGEFRDRGERELTSARFVGKVSDVRPLLHAADLLIHPSLSEGLSNIVLEAMAVGLPVIGTRTGGLRDQIQDGVTGVLVEPANAHALADAAVSLLEDSGRRAKMGAAARVRAERFYNLAGVINAYERLYDGLRPATIPQGSPTRSR
jgi:glycosyltransferase involved in cell wall biosynthesis